MSTNILHRGLGFGKNISRFLNYLEEQKNFINDSRCNSTCSVVLYFTILNKTS
jgi:hypothetical protein